MATTIFTTNTGIAGEPDYDELIRAAVQAPSGHNSQPWKFCIDSSSIEVVPDFSKALPVVDANHRELYISLGCAVENLCLAAKEKGYQPTPSIVQKDDTTYSIRVELAKDQVYHDPLYQAMDTRQTNRSEYNSRMIEPDTISMIREVACQEGTQFYMYPREDDRYKRLSEYIYRGNAIQMQDKAFKQELLSWIRFNKKHIQKTNDGLTHEAIGTPAIPIFLGKMIVSMFLKPKAQNKTDQKKLESSSHLVLFTTQNNTPPEWINLGRTLERFLLKTTSLGIANAYMNPPCEVNTLAEELRESFTENREYPALLLRIGYAEPMPYAPRKEVEKVICNSPSNGSKST
jgi:hypothetical protein